MKDPKKVILHNRAYYSYHNTRSFFKIIVTKLHQLKVRIKEPDKLAYEIEISNNKKWRDLSPEYKKKTIEKLEAFLYKMTKNVQIIKQLN